MNKTTTTVLGVLVAVALVMAFVAYNRTPETLVGQAGQQGPQGERGPIGPVGPQGERGLQGERGPAGRDGVTTTATQTFGSVTGPDFYGPYFAVNGVQKFSERKPINNSTTTPCSIRGPVSASSTLLWSQLVITTGTSTGTVWTFATSTSGFSTTTNGAEFTIASGEQAAMNFTGAAGGKQIPMSPGAYAVWAVEGTAIGSDAVMKGYCEAEFLKF